MTSRTLSLIRLSGAALLVLGLLVSAFPASTAEYNKRPFLDPGDMSKIQRVITHGRTEGARQEEETGGIQANNPNETIVNTGCGELSFGNVRTTGRAGERAPRDNIVIAKDVINAPINCGTRGRR